MENVVIIMPDGLARTLSRLVDASNTAWFPLYQTSKLLLGNGVNNRNRLAVNCKRGVLRVATQEETRLLMLEMAVYSCKHGRTQLVLLASAPGLREALLRLKVPLTTAECVQE